MRECRLMLFHDKLPDVLMGQNRTHSKSAIISEGLPGAFEVKRNMVRKDTAILFILHPMKTASKITWVSFHSENSGSFPINTYTCLSHLGRVLKRPVLLFKQEPPGVYPSIYLSS